MADKGKTEATPPGSHPATGRRIQVRRSGVHGKGVFALKPIAEGETIIEYIGEIITWKQAQKRHPWNPKDPNHTFYFHVDEKHVIDDLRAHVGRLLDPAVFGALERVVVRRRTLTFIDDRHA